MDTESGYINAPTDNDIMLIKTHELHDFRALHESMSGMMRSFTARRDGRIFVVKTLRSCYKNDPVALAALRKEYEIAILIDSPFVVRTYTWEIIPELGESIIMEYCAGDTLEDIISSKAGLSKNEIRQIVGDLAKAVDDIHSVGIVHRDIKPSNIIWNRKIGSLKVIDFGCAHSDSFYAFDGAAGTDGYYVPEDVAAGKQNSYGDWYALGVTISRLSGCAPSSIRGVLTKVGKYMREHKVDSAKSALGLYERESRLKLIKYPLGLIIVLLAVAATAIILNRGKGPESPEIYPNAESASSPHFKMDTFEKITEDVSPIQESGTEPSSINRKEDTPQNNEVTRDNNQGISGGKEDNNENNELPNEYGVKYSEAVYWNKFGVNDFDRFIVQHTDKLISECLGMRADCIGNEHEWENIKKQYASFNYITEVVLHQAKIEFGDIDRQRAKGLIKERLKMWQTSNPELRQ